jgi:integrase
MSLAKLENSILAIYTENDDDFAPRAMKMIADYFAAKAPSNSKIDPQRLGTQSSFISRLRVKLIEKAGALDYLNATTDAQKLFNKMGVLEQLKFQAQSRATGTNKWVLPLVIAPKNIEGVRMAQENIDALKNNRAKIDTGKLREVAQVFDGDRLLEKLAPALTDPDAKRYALAAALLLITGRRTTEILKTAEFSLSRSTKGNPSTQTSDGYKCMFSGQTKEGLFPEAEYEIPLLAPFWVVEKAMQRLRSLYLTQGMTNQQVNESYSGQIRTYTEKMAEMTPHELRACYALMTFQLAEKKMSLIGHISKVLGHAQPGAAAYYQRKKVENFTGPLEIENTTEHKENDFGEWVINGAVEEKRMAGIIEMMKHRTHLTASSIRRDAGGFMPVIMRIMANNKELIDKYNASIAKK